MDIEKRILGRNDSLFSEDIIDFQSDLMDLIGTSSFLVIGGAGSIGQSVVKEIFRRNPKKLHVVDISENNLVELVRDIRSSLGYIKGEFKTFALDMGSPMFRALVEHQPPYDYVLNLSALKHVRSEKDPYTLMRLIDVNIIQTIASLNIVSWKGLKKYFAVSTDKAANPVNMMGASKKIMESFLIRASNDTCISTARFANVAFSDGSLLQGFQNRIEKGQPIVAPNDVRRYFIGKKESGELCLLSAILGENRDIFFPKTLSEKHLLKFSDLAGAFLDEKGFEVIEFNSEEEARDYAEKRKNSDPWPCFFPGSDTTGEKSFEEFFTDSENLDVTRFKSIGVIKSEPDFDQERLENFTNAIEKLLSSKNWNKKEIVNLFESTLPGFFLDEKGKYLDSKM